MLSNLKKWFSKLCKFLSRDKQDLQSGFAFLSHPQPTYEEVEPEVVEYNGTDLRFYTQNYKITVDDKKRLVSLVQSPEFRTFEKYIDWRVNASAHKMKSLLMESKSEAAALEAAEIDALVKITQDMQNFWQEVKMMDIENDILLQEKTIRTPKLYGEGRLSLSTDEAVSI